MSIPRINSGRAPLTRALILATLLQCGCGSPSSVPIPRAPVTHAAVAASQYTVQLSASASIYSIPALGSAASVYTGAKTGPAAKTFTGAVPPGSTIPIALAELEAALRDLPSVPIESLPGELGSSTPGKLVLTGGTHAHDVQRELAELRGEVSQLRTDMDTYLGQYLTELRRENEDLRRELQLARAGRGPREFAPDLPDMPAPGDGAAPGGAFVPGVDGAPPADAAAPAATSPGAKDSAAKNDAKPGPNDTVALAVHGGLNYAVITEWGRSPQDVAQLGGKASSLKGMVCVVPENSSNDQVISLGRFFRNEFKDYDNINIEVFDSRTAAQTYVETNNAAPEHRVLSVSKHKQSGRDTILVFRNGVLTEVGPGS